LKVLLLSRYGRLAPSSRLRSYQYLPFFSEAGIDVEVAPLLDDSYVAALYGKVERRTSILAQYASRIRRVVNARRFQAIWVEKELLPWIPSWLELPLYPRGVPMVVDYDDAVFHRYDDHSSRVVRLALGRKIDHVMANARLVTVGHDYLASRAEAAGARNVVVVPTVVDIKRYKAVARSVAPGDPVVIGWIGNPITARHLSLLKDAVATLQQRFAGRVRVVAIGANAEQFVGTCVEAKEWVEEKEAEDVAQFDIGVMPLPDEPFERGKCGYKLIQYMACGKPVVASPVGVNKKIVVHGETGFLASDSQQWIDMLSRLVQSPDLRERLGANGRKKVEAGYSLQSTAPKLVDIFRKLGT
jgi:glycosyltransferase involved in cell wall biosynthesis